MSQSSEVREEKPAAPSARGAWSCATVVLGLLGSMGALACSSIELGCRGEERCTGDVAVLGWWDNRVQPGTLPDFVQPLQQALEEQTNFGLAYEQRGDRSQYSTLLDLRLGSPDSPLDALLVNGGRELLARTPCGAESRQLQPLDEYFSAEHLQAFDPAVLDTLRCEGRLYGLPVAVQRANQLVYSREFFAAVGYNTAGLRDLQWEQLLGVAEQLQPSASSQEGASRSFFAVPWADEELVTLFFVTDLMLATRGLRAYLDYWAGQEPARETLRPVLDEMLRVLPFANSDVIDAREAARRVADGQAAVMVAGDWANSELFDSPVGLSEIPFPGTQDFRIYRPEAFALPRSTDSVTEPTKGLAWLSAITSPEAQKDFASAKSAQSARLDQLVGGEPVWGAPEMPLLLPPDAGFEQLGQLIKAWAEAGFPEDDAGPLGDLMRYAESQFDRLVEHSDQVALEMREGVIR